MESRPSKIRQDTDRISALPDELLLGILERLSLGQAVRAGAVSTRWRHLHNQLSRLCLNVDYFQGTTPLDTMDAFTAAMCTLLSFSPRAERKCECKSRHAVKILRIRFYPSATHMGSIGCAVEETVSCGHMESFELVTLPLSPNGEILIEFGQQFMSFFRACPVAFRWLTTLSLTSLEFGHSDLPSLIGACDKLKHLSLTSCRLNGHSVLKIDVPNSVITELEFVSFRCTRIELVSVPKLTRLSCRFRRSKKSPLRFGFVPQLRNLTLRSHASPGQAPFALSECFSVNATNLSELHLNFSCQMIWIRPEHPRQPAAIFRNLTNVLLGCIFPECDLSWTLFILEVAPALKKFVLDRTRHSCVKTSEHSAGKTNVMWEPSKDLKHPNLKFLVILGFEEEEKVVKYIRFVMERATGLKKILLCAKICELCDAADPAYQTRFEVDKASIGQIMERLAHGPLLVHEDNY